MNQKTMAGLVVGAIVIAGGAFYAGMSYGDDSGPVAGQGQFASGQFQRGQGGQLGGTRAGRAGTGFTAGEVITKDDTGITVKMQDGSTRIVLTSPTTQVMKSTSGSLADVAVGSEVMVTGTANGDGSVTAQTVQLRPAGSPTGFPRGTQSTEPTQNQ